MTRIAGLIARPFLLLALLSASVLSPAAAAPIAWMNVAAGSLNLGGTGAMAFANFGPNTNLVGGYIGNGGAGLDVSVGDAGGIAHMQFSSLAISIYTASSNLGDDFTTAGTIAGGPVPTGALDAGAGTITLDLSSWFLNWNNNDIHAGTGKADGVTSAFATGTWDSNTGAYSLSWQSLAGIGPNPIVAAFTLEGVAAPVPEPGAFWLLTAGLLVVGARVRSRRGQA